VHNVICQQVLRLCQMQWYKRQSSNKGTVRQIWWTVRELTGGVPSPTEPSTAAPPEGRHVRSPAFVRQRLAADEVAGIQTSQNL